jgi:hypothetical protein
VLEKQEAAAVFGEIAFTAIGNIAEAKIKEGKWEIGGAESIALHALVGGLMAEINGGKFGDGLTVGAINEIVVGMLDRSKEETKLTKEEILWISNILGKALGGSQGQGIAGSATQNNWLSHEQKLALEEAKRNGDQELVEFYEELDRKQNYIATMMGIDWQLIDWDDPINAGLRDSITAQALKIDVIPEISWDVLTTNQQSAVIAGGVVVGVYVVYKIDGMLWKVPVGSSIATNTAANIASNVTHNPKATEVVLGKFNSNVALSYQTIASQRGATYFYIDQAKWEVLSRTLGEEGMWAINEQFLLQQISQGKTFILTSNPYTATGTFAQEVSFLTKGLGYKIVVNGNLWNLVK